MNTVLASENKYPSGVNVYWAIGLSPIILKIRRISCCDVTYLLWNIQYHMLALENVFTTVDNSVNAYRKNDLRSKCFCFLYRRLNQTTRRVTCGK